MKQVHWRVASKQFLIVLTRKDSLGLQTGRRLVLFIHFFLLFSECLSLYVPRSVDNKESVAMMLTITNVIELVQKGLRLHRNQTSKFSSWKFCKKKFFWRKNFIKNFLKKNFKKKIFFKKIFYKKFIKISKNS